MTTFRCVLLNDNGAKGNILQHSACYKGGYHAVYAYFEVRYYHGTAMTCILQHDTMQGGLVTKRVLNIITVH
jgi:hypothetical protein